MSILKSRKHQRQKFAYDCFQSVQNGIKSKYKTQIEKLGMILYTNGLTSTLAYIKAGRENNNEFRFLYKHLTQWILQENPIIGFSIENDDDLLEKVLEIDNSRVVLALTQEFLTLSDALKEIVKAES